MNSPCLPAALAEPAADTNAAATPAAASFRTSSEIRGKLHTAWTDHRSTAREPGEVARRRTAVSRSGAAADREVQHGAERQAGPAHCKRDRGDVALQLG